MHSLPIRVGPAKATDLGQPHLVGCVLREVIAMHSTRAPASRRARATMCLPKVSRRSPELKGTARCGRDCGGLARRASTSGNESTLGEKGALPSEKWVSP